MAERNLSWANWSLGDKNEASAALRVGASPDGNWTASDLTASGKLVFAALQQSKM
jgi:endoglucanase